MTIMMPTPDRAVLGRRDASVKALRAMGGNSEVRRIAADAEPAASLENHPRKHSSRTTYYTDPDHLFHLFQQTRSERIQNEIFSKARP